MKIIRKKKPRKDTLLKKTPTKIKPKTLNKTPCLHRDLRGPPTRIKQDGATHVFMSSAAELRARAGQGVTPSPGLPGPRGPCDSVSVQNKGLGREFHKHGTYFSSLDAAF